MTSSTPPRPLAVGDRIHGYCGGYFGRDHYDCGTVEAVGRDWVVARSIQDGHAFSTTGENILTELAEFRNEKTCKWYANWMNDEGCFEVDVSS